MLSFSLLPSVPLTAASTPLLKKFLDIAGGLPVTTNDGLTSSDDVKVSSTTTSIFAQSTAVHSSASDQSWVLESQTAYVVGPMMYMHFSAANTSDAGFTVDLLFQHPSYLKASARFILFD